MDVVQGGQGCPIARRRRQAMRLEKSSPAPIAA
jgi:hypothetical protein